MARSTGSESLKHENQHDLNETLPEPDGSDENPGTDKDSQQWFSDNAALESHSENWVQGHIPHYKSQIWGTGVISTTTANTLNVHPSLRNTVLSIRKVMTVRACEYGR